jgi:hypothetical protein
LAESFGNCTFDNSGKFESIFGKSRARKEDKHAKKIFANFPSKGERKKVFNRGGKTERISFGWFWPGLPDGLFSNQKFQIWVNSGGPLHGKCWYIL